MPIQRARHANVDRAPPVRGEQRGGLGCADPIPEQSGDCPSPCNDGSRCWWPATSRWSSICRANGWMIRTPRSPHKCWGAPSHMPSRGTAMRILIVSYRPAPGEFDTVLGLLYAQHRRARAWTSPTPAATPGAVRGGRAHLRGVLCGRARRRPLLGRSRVSRSRCAVGGGRRDDPRPGASRSQRELHGPGRRRTATPHCMQ